ncbi:hypothetical protein EDC94DRAFT_650961 [Helicostylum pulchrum]|nr:hypothetical protein EDC94DRAFT_650961 [Helicostylum pulchrum]
MRRKKQRQFLLATPALNQLPTWRRKGQKRARRNLLESESESEPTDKKNSGKSLDDLKNQCMTKKRLDRGIVTGAEERIGARAAEIENMLRKRRKTQTPLQHWFELVESDFDRLVSDYRKDVKGKGKEVEVEVLSQKIEEISLIEEDKYGPSSSSSLSKTQTVESLHQPEGSSDNPQS